MLSLLARRLLGLAATLAAASVIVFLLVDLLPGDAAELMLGVNARPDTLAALRAELGTDRPAFVRYVGWVGGILTGDFGISYTYREPVTALILERMEVSLPLAVGAIVLSTLLAIPLGVVAAAFHRRAGDYGIMAFTQVGVAIPNFWLGLLLIMLFATTLGLLPAGRFPGWRAGLWPGVEALVLPVISLALPQAAILARVVRTSVIEVMGEMYVRTARAKGLSRSRVMIGHALRNALIPIVTVIGLQLSFLVASAIVIEGVFTLPGLGRLILQSISNRDLVVVQGVVLLLAAMVVLVNFLVDVSYLLLDPRIRLARHGT
ncbi:MAG: ABC transporter permease [Alphaproteobacteria bacterium]